MLLLSGYQLITFLLNTIIIFIVWLVDIAGTAKLGMQLVEMAEDFVLGNPLFAFEADEVSILAVDIEVFLLVGRLAECHPATLNWANVGFFHSVGAQMIKEVVPFSKIHATVLFVAGVYI
jgi:hypothetical protein